MPLQENVRKELQKAVTRVRTILTEDFTLQCKTIYGIQPDGTFIDLTQLGHLSEEEKSRATVLRDRVDHLAAAGEGQQTRADAVDRMLREQAFTVLNRLCALRLCEERGLLQECVRNGLQSRGFRLFEENAAYLGGNTFERYVLYVSLLHDELSTELGVLFDRFSSSAVLFPREKAWTAASEQINQPSLQTIWSDDETIGWIYQYFNPPEERKAMREQSQAPRNSREMAVRNQFFTPRYVVEFLADNTLGRIWYEMRKGRTRLTGECRYLLRSPSDVFLAKGERVPVDSAAQTDLDRKEPVKLSAPIEHRSKKDPRDLRILDPACGSGHFLLYSFDLLERIYEEAWSDPESPRSEVTGQTLYEDYPSLDDLRRYAPKLIVEYNLNGIDIDARAVQIAALALWLRAQNTWKGIRVGVRPVIAKSNLVTAEPMPGEDQIRKEFVEGLRPKVLGQLVAVVFEKMRLAGEAGSLLKVEAEIKDAIAVARTQWQEGPKPEQQLLFTTDSAPPQPKQGGFRFEVHEITDATFWHQAEHRILAALQDYAELTESRSAVRRRLFSQDVARGFSFIDLCSRRYDVVLMNPPFGDASLPSKPYIEDAYGDTKGDVYKAFVECFSDRLVPAGYLGIISSRSGFFLSQSEDWRTRVVLRLFRPTVLADLGLGVLDAMVEVAAYVLRRLSREEEIDLTLSLLPFLEKVNSDRVGRFSLPKWQTARGDLKRFQAVAELLQLEASGYIQRSPGQITRYTPVWHRVKTARASQDIVYPPLACIRALGVSDKASCLEAAIARPSSDCIFVCDPSSFFSVPGVRFAYWVEDDVRRLFQLHMPLEAEGRDVQSGASTMDDFRFLRLGWEVPPGAQARSREATLAGGRWVPLAKGGAFSRYYCDWRLVIDWASDGSSLKSHVAAYRGSKGWGYHWAAAINGHSEYFRPGLTWSRRTQGGLSIRAMPAGGIFGDKGPAIFAQHNSREELLQLLAITNSLPFRALVGLQVAFGSFEVGVLERTPIPPLNSKFSADLARLGRQAYEIKRSLDLTNLTSHAFFLPALAIPNRHGLADWARMWSDSLREKDTALTAIQEEIDNLAAQLYGLPDKYRIEPPAAMSVVGEADASEDEEAAEASDDVVAQTLDLLSWILGALFGQWDIRIALASAIAPRLPHPFDPLPICAPGMLVGSSELPAQRDFIASGRSLGIRLGWNTDQREHSGETETIPDSEYPLRISWDGMLVDDPGLNDERPHHEDIMRRMREVFDLLWRNKAAEIEQEVCDILGVPELRDLFRRPGGFFQVHLKRYSQSRRKAPIYWPLSSESGRYTLWIYYPQLSDQTLFRCVNEYLDPKVEEIERELNRLSRSEASRHKTLEQRDKLEELQSDLRSMRAQILEIAQLPYRPNLNDGVLINAAPLWPLFRHKPWQTELRKCWEALKSGKYDWSHMAYNIWPDRVREACRKDQSIAIAHGLEDLYEHKETKKVRGRKK